MRLPLLLLAGAIGRRVAAGGAVGKDSVRAASALDIGTCLGIGPHDALVVEDCLDGRGDHWLWTVDSAQEKGKLRLAGDREVCAGAATLTAEPCADQPEQDGWYWNYTSLQIVSGRGKCLTVVDATLVLKQCIFLEPQLAGCENADQCGIGGPSTQAWVLMPSVRPQIDILSHLNFPLRTSGRYVVDASGHRVKLVGVNWVGAHTLPLVNFGLNYVSLKHIVQYIKHMGFNHVRISYALSMLHAPGKPIPTHPEDFPPIPNQQSIKANPELYGLSALEIFDRCIKALTDEGLLVILNNHMSAAGWCCSETDGSSLWFNEEYSTEDWLNALTFMSHRYKADPRVFGHDIRNEPRPDMRKSIKPLVIPAWGVETDLFKPFGFRLVDWRRAASLGAVAAWKGNPETNVIVEGNWFASDLATADTLKLSLAQDCLSGRLFYSVHEYPWFSFIYAVWGHFANPFRWNEIVHDFKQYRTEKKAVQQHEENQPPLSQMRYERFKETRLESGWDLVTNGIAPVWASEFGADMRWRSPWYNNTFRLFRELDSDWCWWLLDTDKVPEGFDKTDPDGTVDSYAIFNLAKRDYKSVNGWKLQDLISIMAPDPSSPAVLDVSPSRCTFDYASNLASAGAPTDNYMFVRSIHWAWYKSAVLFVALLVIVACFPLVVCVCCAKKVYGAVCARSVTTGEKEKEKEALIQYEQEETRKIKSSLSSWFGCRAFCG